MSSASSASVPSFFGAGPFGEMSSAFSVYLGRVSWTDWCRVLRHETYLRKQIVHLSEAFIFLALVASHKNASIMVVYAGCADDDFSI